MESKNFTIANIDFSDDDLKQVFDIEHDAQSPMCLWLHVFEKHKYEPERDIDKIITLRACEMKALGKALVFAAEYVEELYGDI